MKKYWDAYSMREKLYELGELSARRSGLMLDAMSELHIHDINIKENFLKLISGVETDVCKLADLCDEIIKRNSEDDNNV